MRCPFRLRAALAPVLIGVATPAHAHDVFGLSAAPFWLGALHLLVAPLGIVAVVALAAAVPFSSGRTILAAALAAGVASFATAHWAPAPVAAAGPLGIVIAGICAACGVEPARGLGLLLGALTGCAAGAAAQLDSPALSAALGVGIAMTSLALWGVEVFIHTQRFVPLARRVVGAWMAAIALLLGALAIRVHLLPHS